MEEEEFGFIIVRHVNSIETDKYWKESYRCVRKYFDCKIIMIDDNSNKDFLNSDITLVNCTVINSEYPGRGEMLAYYYFHKLRPFYKAVVIHDSVFLNSKIEIQEGYLWSFLHGGDEDEKVLSLLPEFNNSSELIAKYLDKSSWVGNFGMMGILNWNTLDNINNKYDLLNVVLKCVDTRSKRQSMERILACALIIETGRNDAQFGNIHAYVPWGVTYDSYVRGELNHLPVIKVWTGR
jgi:hypothetical protein